MRGAARHLLSGRGLIVGALLLPTLLYGVVALQDRKLVFNRSELLVSSTVRIFEEHARGVLQTHKLIASMVNDHIRGLDWQGIAASEALHEYLADIVYNYPQIQSLWLIDRSGLIRNSSAVFPAPSVSVNDRDYFIALREHDTGLFLGRLVHGRVFTEDIFNVAIRRSSPSDSFDGVVVVSALPSYFTNFWDEVADQPGAAAALVRQDGSNIAREPAANADTLPLPATSQLMQAIAGSDTGFIRGVSAIFGGERLYAFQKVSGFPVYADYGISVKGALRTWHQHLLLYGAFFGIGTLALALLALVAARRAEREAAALHAWRETAERLRKEAEHRKIIEGELRQAQKMEALGQVAGEVAHDFGNILTVISGRLEMLRNHPGDVKMLTLAQEAAERGTNAVHSMLSFVRRQPLRSQVFDLNATLRGMESLLRQATGAEIRLDMVLAPAQCWTEADQNQTELAILNLALNARDAMPQGGRLTVTTKTVRLAGEPDDLAGDFIALAVRDTGTGMPPEVQARVFEPFFTTKGPGKGTGLGLSMVYGFAAQSHGAVAIDSTVGQGTSVVLYLPRRAPKADNAMTMQHIEDTAVP
jgi:two-component system, NtrC family, sensor kinase